MNSLLTVDSGYPMEIIVHDDGSDDKIKKYLSSLARQGKISYLIQNAGKNRGIGEAIRNCFKIASGDYLIKCDTDLEFKPGWLKETVRILQDEKVGAVSLFNYNHYDPNDKRFKIEQEKDNFYVVSDFVSSIYGVRREIYEGYKNTLDTDGWHQYIKSKGYNLAISKKDFVDNFGFGLFKSIYVTQNENGEITTTKTYKEPLIF
jgi:glycosyltransferase involved in cell wall biosynthesis